MAFSTGTSNHYGPSNTGRELLFSQLGVGSGGELLDGAVGEGQWNTHSRTHNPPTSDLPGVMKHLLTTLDERPNEEDDDNDDDMDCESVTTMDLEAARKMPGFLDSPSRSRSSSGSIGKILTTASNAYQRSKTNTTPSPSSPSPSSSPSSSSPSSPNHRSSDYPNKEYDPDFLAALSMLKHSLKGVNPLHLLKVNPLPFSTKPSPSP